MGYVEFSQVFVVFAEIFPCLLLNLALIRRSWSQTFVNGLENVNALHVLVSACFDVGDFEVTLESSVLER